MDDTEIDVEFSEPVNAAIKIENASGVVKSLYTSSGKVTDPTTKIWYGTDDGGTIVADDTYHVNVTMDDGVNPLVYNNTETITVATHGLLMRRVTVWSGTAPPPALTRITRLMQHQPPHTASISLNSVRARYTTSL
jgi:flagellar hook assembly protein FlgD